MWQPLHFLQLLSQFLLTLSSKIYNYFHLVGTKSEDQREKERFIYDHTNTKRQP